jgi:hypothetical protein
MEEFVVKIKDNIGKKTEAIKDQKDPRFRKLISKIIQSVPDVNIFDSVNKDGDVQFSVSMADLGLTFDLFLKYKNEIFSDFMANFLGELLVRENINQFRQLLTSINVDEYNSMVSHFEHRQFGMEVTRNKFIFLFHVSLLHSLLTEGFRKKIK